jgi:hypothetical protein
MSSSGEMKMSLKLITCGLSGSLNQAPIAYSYILMSQMLEELQFSVCALGEDGGAEGLHDLLDGHGLVGELIFGGTAKGSGGDAPALE